MREKNDRRSPEQENGIKIRDVFPAGSPEVPESKGERGWLMHSEFRSAGGTYSNIGNEISSRIDNLLRGGGHFRSDDDDCMYVL